MHKYVLVLVIVLKLVSSQTTSPCPEVFSYESRGTEPDRWYGVLSLRTKEDLNGVWIRIVLDREAEQLGNWFGEATSADNKEFLIKNSKYKLQVGPAVPVRLFVKYNTTYPPPTVKTIRLNGKIVCSDSHEENTTIQVQLHLSKPSTGTSSSNNNGIGLGIGSTTSSSNFNNINENSYNERPSSSNSRPNSGSSKPNSYNERPSSSNSRPTSSSSEPRPGGSFNGDSNRETVFGGPNSNSNENYNNNNNNNRPESSNNYGESSNNNRETSSSGNSNNNYYNRETEYTSEQNYNNNNNNNRPSQNNNNNNYYNNNNNRNEESNSNGGGDFFPGDFLIHERPQQVRPSSSKNPLQSNNRNARCGTVAVRASPLISFGQTTSPGQWPWHAALYHSQGIQLTYTCGGTLISPNHIITAAHCVTRLHSNKPVNSQNLLVYLGKYNLKKFGSEVEDREISKIFVHPNYNYSVYFNDIAILKLSEPIEVTDFVRPCCLWEDSTDLDNILDTLGTVVGWGFDENKKLSNDLTKAEMPVVSALKCIYSNRDFFSHFTFEKTFCAGFRNGTSVCNGDSGGGMVFPKRGTSGSDTIWQLRGIVSVGVALQGEPICDTSHYVVFTDVAKHLDWIRETLAYL